MVPLEAVLLHRQPTKEYSLWDCLCSEGKLQCISLGSSPDHQILHMITFPICRAPRKESEPTSSILTGFLMEQGATIGGHLKGPEELVQMLALARGHLITNG